jgi:D-arabinose 1-dehydrogenase-like Zn-dependent alcohol dehydrogenase
MGDAVVKAARVNPGATGVSIEEIPDPELRPGSVVVQLEAAFASHFITKIIDGSGGYTVPPHPFTPGMDAIGTVERIGDGVRGLRVGDRVYCDSYYEPKHPATTGERVFIGNFALGPQSVALLAEWPDGAYAEKICLPAECIYPIRPAIDLPGSILCRLGSAFGAFRKAGLAAGDVVAVNGASGLLGSSAVMAALALGASRVFALGRRKDAVERVAALDARVEAGTDPSTAEPVDTVLSSVDGEDAASLEALLPKVRRHGRVVTVGAPKAPLKVPMRWLMANEITLRGSLWFERGDVEAMLRLIASGAMDLSMVEAEEYELDRLPDALDAAHRRDDPLDHVAILCR